MESSKNLISGTSNNSEKKSLSFGSLMFFIQYLYSSYIEFILRVESNLVS